MDKTRKRSTLELIGRRDVLNAGVRAGYIVPAILAVVKATERPAYATVSGAHPVPPHEQGRPRDEHSRRRPGPG